MANLEFTGERFTPGSAGGEIAYEHWHRYAFARRFVADRRVLDAACGEGYGTALLGAAAKEAVGIDIDAAAIDHARASYGMRPGVRYEQGSVTALPLADRSIDVVVSFETIEHLPEADQPRMLAEFARVLAPEGLLVLSSPNRRRYSDERDYRNPFHLHELYRDELERLLDAAFPHRRWFHQTRSFASALWREDADALARNCEAWTGDDGAIVATPAPDGLYHVVLASSSAVALPAFSPDLSLFADRDDTELKRAEAQAREIMRLDELLKRRDAAGDQQTRHIRHLESLVAERERIVEERDAQLVEVNAARESRERGLVEARERMARHEAELAAARATLERCQADLSAARTVSGAAERQKREQELAIAAQERIIAYRQTARWWLRLPLIRTRLMWQRWRGR